MYIPSNFADPVEEYWHLVNHATVWDVGCERQVEIRGPDGYEFMEYLTPRDLTTCKVGQAKYVVLTDEQGGLINDPVLTRLGKNRFWLSTADSDVLLWAKGVSYHSDFDVGIREPDVSPMQIQGPKSKDVLRALVGPSVSNLEYYHFLETTIDGIPVIVTRTGWSAEVGYEIYLCDGSRGTDLWNRVMAAGKPFDLRPTGPSEYRRIEAGILNYPSDINWNHNPYEAGLGWLVDLDKKHDFIGRAALRKIKKEGPKKKLVGVEVLGDEVVRPWLPHPWPVRKDGKEVGTLTALAMSPRLQKNIGYAWLPIPLTKLGTEIEIVTPVGSRKAIVVKKPFIDPKKETPKS
ncbi:MAG: glycine cleavage system protein T [Methanobacteriota archaeon]|nr:MAG: glycine cleavage system protein T [Euryarchaeota archaeon]TLZ90417.1 MAG: glycine cleavage system protein T [Euryarchaeota archaeon]